MDLRVAAIGPGIQTAAERQTSTSVAMVDVADETDKTQKKWRFFRKLGGWENKSWEYHLFLSLKTSRRWIENVLLPSNNI